MSITVEHVEVIPISVHTLVPQAALGLSLYLPGEADNRLRLYRGGEYPLTTSDLDALRQRGVSRLYVPAGHHKKYQAYLRENLDLVLDDESIPIEGRAGCLNNVVRDVLNDAFKRHNLEIAIVSLKSLGEKTVNLICNEEIVLTKLRSVLYHDYHTFTHSANVAFYAVMLAHALGHTSASELGDIALGALLHDAGKLDIPQDILTKPGRLDDDEQEVMRRHPALGFRRLALRNDLSMGQFMMVYQHHERVDGTGYPTRSVSDEIHKWAKICSVADVFEALTSNRPYRAGLPFDEACAIMIRQSGTAFETGILECWTRLILNG